MTIQTAILALEDGSVFQGVAIGAMGETTGEVVFNTAITGYQEILTDPSYAKQIVTLTYPHIGSVGTNPIDAESTQTHAAGLIIKNLPRVLSNWRSELSLDDYLKQNNIVAIANVDTRRLTRILREKGAQNGCIVTGDANPEKAIEQAKSFAGLKGMDLAQEVSTTEKYEWRKPSWALTNGTIDAAEKEASDLPYHVVAYDFGVKQNILRMLVDRGCKVTVVPAKTPAAEVKALNPDGVFLSNGPGDPEPCTYAVESIQEVLTWKKPVFGICLGHQLLALASGAKSLKMKFGHHGANHPVKNLQTNVVAITSQNHGFAIDADSLPADIEATHVSLFDGSLQGIKHKSAPAFSFQGHPEASPGPHDLAPLFDQFVDTIRSHVN